MAQKRWIEKSISIQIYFSFADFLFSFDIAHGVFIAKSPQD